MKHRPPVLGIAIMTKIIMEINSNPTEENQGESLRVETTTTDEKVLKAEMKRVAAIKAAIGTITASR